MNTQKKPVPKLDEKLFSNVENEMYLEAIGYSSKLAVRGYKCVHGLHLHRMCDLCEEYLIRLHSRMENAKIR